MTRKLYHENQYLQNFSSLVIERIDYEKRPAVVLQQTAFYPTSGGQPHDTGTLNDIKVLDVIEGENGRILHLVAHPLENDRVEGQVDWERRFDHMQQHTGQHLLSQVFLRLCDAETLSFHLGSDISSIDVNQPDLDPESVQFVEAMTNQILYENRKVTAHRVTSDEAARFPVRKLPTVEDNIRIVEIEEFDYSPCGGTHCAHTGEIGILKITKTENYKGGTRVHFLCGGRALRDYQHKTLILRQVADMMSSGEHELPGNISKLQEDAKRLYKEQNTLTQQLLAHEARSLSAACETVGDWKLLVRLFEDRNPKDLKTLASTILEDSPKTVILFGGKHAGKASLLFMRSPELSCNMGELMKTACDMIHGRGGGQPHQAQGGGPEVETLEQALEYARDSLIHRA